MPADPRDLCTVAQVKTALQKKSSDTTQDTMIQDAITDASQILMDEYEQEFAPTTNGATRTFEYPFEGQLLNLAPYALRNVTAVVMDSDQGAGYTLSTDEWRLWPQPQRDGVALAIRLRPLSGVFGRIMWKDRQVKITGDWGYASVPLNAKRACIMTVRHWHVTSNGTFRHADDDSADDAAPQRGIPPEARELMRRYRRVVVL